MLPNQATKSTSMLLLGLLSLLTLTSCASKSNRFGVIFTSDNGVAGAIDIYRIPDNTQGESEQLSFTPTIGEYQLLVSKNGDKIVFEAGPTSLGEDSFEANAEKRRHIYLLDTTSKEFVDITNILVQYETVWQNFSMDWSSDQKRFVVIMDDVVDSEVRSYLELVDLDGKNKIDVFIPTMSEIPSVINSVKWSPDGKKFVLTRGVIGNEQQLQNLGSPILVYDLVNGNLMQITDYKDQCFPREWSPTSQQIVSTCSFPTLTAEGVSGATAVRIFDVENPGQPYERIAFSSCNHPSWSPDGKRIAFVCEKATGQMGLFIINSDGNGIHEVVLETLENPAVLRYPTWSPDGTQIVYVAGTDSEHTNIYSVAAGGSDNYALTHKEAFYSIVSVYPRP